jgi:hypothetical protein
VPEGSPALIIRVPRSSYLVVGFLAVGIAPLALYGGTDHPQQATISPLSLLYIIPVLVAFYIARTLTMVNADGIIVRALFGQRALPWSDIRGLSISGRSIYAVLADGAVRLPCVRTSDLAAVSAASGGRLPELAQATPKYAPGRRSRQ